MNHSLLILMFFSLFLFENCEKRHETTSPQTADITESVYASGVVKSENQYEVFANVNGIVETIFIKEGELVKKGTPIFQIKNVNSTLSAENARLLSLANDYSIQKEKIAEARKNLEFAQIKLKNDSLLFARQQSLWNQNIGSKIELEQKELNYENAKVNLKRMQVALDDVNRQLKLASDQSKNNLKIAQASRNDLIIRSEVDGYLYKINVRQGEMAASSSPLAVVGQKRYLIELNVDEFDIVKIKKKQKVLIRMDSYQRRLFEAEVSFVYPMMNERTRTFKVDAVFLTQPEVLYPNLTLEANIVIHEKKNVLTIPTSYLVNDSTVLLEDGTPGRIKIGLKDYSMAEILSGIDKGTKIRMPE